MSRASDLIDQLMTQVAAHAKLPVGSAAAYDAAGLVSEARALLFRHVSELSDKAEKYRSDLQELLDLINSTVG